MSRDVNDEDRTMLSRSVRGEWAEDEGNEDEDENGKDDEAPS
jgi:hypothetical protein